MSALGWQISRSKDLVVVRGVGVFDLPFIISFREAMRAAGAAGAGKLFDLSRAEIRLSRDDLSTLADHTRRSAAVKSGPIALNLGPEPDPLLVDMAVLFKNWVGHRRRLRLFTSELEARLWLAEQGPEINQPLLRLPSSMTTRLAPASDAAIR